MIFGYYHIPVLTAKKEDNQLFGFPPNSTMHLKVKVGHVLFIPFIPLDMYWVLHANDNDFRINPKAEKILKEKYGKRSYPWYSFLGFIIIGAFILYGLTLGPYLDNKKRKAYQKKRTETFITKLEKRDNAIFNADTTDYYHFKNKRGEKVVFKVDRTTKDSIYFEIPSKKEKRDWQTDNYAVGFYQGDTETKFIRFAKEDLRNSYPRESASRRPVEYLNHAKDQTFTNLELEKIVHFKMSESVKSTIPMVDDKEHKKIEANAYHIIENITNSDSLNKYMDSKSKKYFSDLLDYSYRSDVESSNFAKDRNNRIYGGYEYMLFTRFVFLDSYDNETSKKKTQEEKINDLIFFLRLMDKSFLTISDELFKGLKIIKIETPNSHTATLKCQANSNLLKSTKRVTFQVEMNKEDGIWKMNIPSSYSYTISQLWANSQMGNFTNLEMQYKEMLRKQLEEDLGAVPLSNNWK